MSGTQGRFGELEAQLDAELKAHLDVFDTVDLEQANPSRGEYLYIWVSMLIIPVALIVWGAVTYA
jgi:hypothetical protein